MRVLQNGLIHIYIRHETCQQHQRSSPELPAGSLQSEQIWPHVLQRCSGKPLIGQRRSSGGEDFPGARRAAFCSSGCKPNSAGRLAALRLR
eukprot:s5363_g2.t1